MAWSLSWTEIAGFVTGAVCVWLTVRGNVVNFPIGIANNVAFWVLFVQAGLYADAWLQVVYVVLGGVGWYWWLHGGADRTALVVRPTPRWGWGVALVVVVAGTGVTHALLAAYTDSAVPWGDALTTALSLGAQLMLNRKWVGNWWLWIVADVLYVGLYVVKGLYLTSILYAGFFVLCLVGLRRWRRRLGVRGAAAGRPGPPRRLRPTGSPSRVVVIGAESTGTTTLANDLARHYGAPWVPEYGREWSQVRPGGLSAPWSTDEFDHIADEQTRQEREALGDNDVGLVVSDTDVLATTVWHERYVGRTSATLSARADAWRPDLYLLTGDEIPFVQDGLRDGEHLRHYMQRRFREVLTQTEVPWLEVHGSPQERLAIATGEVDALLRRDRDGAPHRSGVGSLGRPRPVSRRR